ncbi:unnamed protein product [Linum trigynum]|uniref:Uncharacterized protein n=1 Tax=Linum trigynum TaxID=586398 RepID=A0AAV2FT50_9ROSI
MQESIGQILAMLKEKSIPEKGNDTHESSRKQKTKGKEREEDPESPAQTVGEESEKEENAEDFNLSFLEEHLRPSYERAKAHNNILQNPLAKSLFRTQVPSNFSSMGLPTYSGIFYTTDHLSAFMLKMQLINASDADLCKAFPVTFDG